MTIQKKKRKKTQLYKKKKNHKNFHIFTQQHTMMLHMLIKQATSNMKYLYAPATSPLLKYIQQP